MTFERLYPDSEIRRELESILADSLRHAHELGSGLWSISVHDNGQKLNLVVGRIFVLQFRPDGVSVTVDDETLDPSVRDMLRETAGDEGVDSFASVPGASWYSLAPEAFLDRWDDLAPAHIAAVEAAAQVVEVTPYHRAFSERAVVALEEDLGEPLPRPSYPRSVISDRLVERLVALIRSEFPGWEGLREPGFEAGEIEYKRKAATEAQTRLAESELTRLVEEEDWEELKERIERVARATNLLWLSVPQSGDLGLLYWEELDRPRFGRAFRDLLHGAGDGPDRLARWVQWTEEAGVPDRLNKWTFPTYFLFLLNPIEEYFVKPSTTRGFIELAGLDIERGPNPDADTYSRIRDAAVELREALRDWDAEDMIDVQSVLWLAVKQHERIKARVKKTIEEIGSGVQKVFEEHRDHPGMRLAHRLKRQRAAELRELLAEPEAVDLATFNREVWAIESQTRLGDRDVTGKIARMYQENDPDLAAALESGELELHGNYMFASGASVYGSMLASSARSDGDVEAVVQVLERSETELSGEELAARLTAAGHDSVRLSSPAGLERLVRDNPDAFEVTDDGRIRVRSPDEMKLENVRQALSVLNDDALELVEKARQIMEIPGFGRNSATGLCMIFHPDEFALYNATSQSAIEKLGLDGSRLERFQTSARLLKEAVGANDFIELDFFLYRLNEGQIELPSDEADRTGFWWVNQTGSYEGEREGGYVWASTGSGAGNPASHHETLARLKPGDYVLHYANGALRAVGEVGGKVETGAKPGSEGTAEEGKEGWYAPVRYQELEETIPLEDIPLAWRTSERGPFDRKGGVNQRYMYAISEELAGKLVERFPELVERGLDVTPVEPTDYERPPFEEIRTAIRQAGMKLEEDVLRRYHMALGTRGFVILSGISGTGKTWLTELYARAVDARYRLVPVAPNWTSNEDLLGYYNPIDRSYYDTSFSRFLRAAAEEWRRAEKKGVTPRPFHLALDEMNLARVEYYFARFLSAMEVRAREGSAEIELGPDDSVVLPSNLFFVGTVNIDETTHGFADKVFDRAQVLELRAPRDLLWAHLGDVPYREAVMKVWDIVRHVAPFAFRVVDEIEAYVTEAEELGVSWKTAVDEQVVQKVLPKLKGADPRLGEALLEIMEWTTDDFPLTRAKAEAMNESLSRHGFASYF